jgi:mannosyltransferase OCH1-like enzyme
MQFLKNKIIIYLNDNFLDKQAFYKSTHEFKLYITTKRVHHLNIQIFSDDLQDNEQLLIHTGKNSYILQTKKIRLIPKDIFITPSQIIQGQKLIHRTLLYDACFPEKVVPIMEQFIINHLDFKHVLWTNRDVIDLIITKDEKYNIYHDLKNIQKSDFARYLILYHYGGMYADFDIMIHRPLNVFINQNQDCTVFVEHIHKENERYLNQIIRNKIPEDPIRIANYLMIACPYSTFIKKVLDLLFERIHLRVSCDYDVIYTTGPDLTSTVYANDRTPKLIDKATADSYFSHQCSGHWRTDR